MTDTFIRLTYRGQQYVMTEEELDDLADMIQDWVEERMRKEKA